MKPALNKSNSIPVDPNLPEWLNELPPEDVIWGIGIAKLTDVSMSMTTAETRANTAIASQLNSIVRYIADQQNTTIIVSKYDVSGTRPIKRWQSPDGTWWILAEMSKKDAKKSISDILEIIESGNDLQNSLQLLDDRLTKAEKPFQIDN